MHSTYDQRDYIDKEILLYAKEYIPKPTTIMNMIYNKNSITHTRV